MTNITLRQPEVLRRLGISASTLWYRLDKNHKSYDPNCPRPFRLSPKGNAVGWLEHEINDYVAMLAEKNRL